MEKLKKMLPSLLLILFEIAVGVLLLIDAEKFTIAVYIVFGSVLILCALAMLVRYLKERSASNKAKEEWKKAIDSDKDSKNDNPMPEGVSPLALISAIVTFVFGAVFAFGSAALYNLTLLLVIFYGAIMIIKGIFKIADYVSLLKEGVGVSVLRLIIGILSIVLGVVMIAFSSNARDTMFIIAAISLLVEAALDILTLILGHRISKQMSVTIESDSDGNEDD